MAKRKRKNTGVTLKGLNRRETKAKGKYRYRNTDTGKRIRVKVGYGETGTNKIRFANGNLTAFGKEWFNNYTKGMGIDEINYLKTQLNSYRPNETMTKSRFLSHLKDDALDRMIYNLGTNAENIVSDINELLTDGKDGTDVEIWDGDIYGADWNFDDGKLTITLDNGTQLELGLEFNYEEYNGYKITR